MLIKRFFFEKPAVILKLPIILVFVLRLFVAQLPNVCPFDDHVSLSVAGEGTVSLGCAVTFLCKLASQLGKRDPALRRLPLFRILRLLLGRSYFFV